MGIVAIRILQLGLQFEEILYQLRGVLDLSPHAPFDTLLPSLVSYHPAALLRRCAQRHHRRSVKRGFSHAVVTSSVLEMRRCADGGVLRRTPRRRVTGARQ